MRLKVLRIPTIQHKQIIGLDALRVFAAIIVVAFHYGFTSFSPGGNSSTIPTHAYDFMQSWVNFGWIGVQIFFVLSGFVIAYSAYSAEPWSFLRQRLSRLLPAISIFSFITGAVAIYYHQMRFTSAVRLTFNSLVFRPGATYIDGPYWTLTLEMSFYLICFTLLLFRLGNKLSLVMGLLGCMSATYNISNFFQSRSKLHFFKLVVDQFQHAPFHQALFLRYACYFAIGVYLWLCLFHARTWPRMLVLCLICPSAILEILIRTREISLSARLPASTIAPVLVWIATVALVVCATRANAILQASLPLRFLVSLRHASLVTYPLYLVHMTLGKLLICSLIPSCGPFVALTLTLVVIFSIAYSIASYLEPRGRAYLTRALIRTGAYLSGLLTLWQGWQPVLGQMRTVQAKSSSTRMTTPMWDEKDAQ